MKKIVLTFGIISGIIGIILMSVMTSVICTDPARFGTSEVLGYASMLLSLLFIYIGMNTYKKNVGNGYISFGTSIKIGLLITLIYTILYVIAWMIIYYNFMPDFWEKYAAYTMTSMREKGASETAIQAQAAQMAQYAEYYKNPLYIILFTFIEPLPVGIIVTLISALLVRIRNKPKNMATV